MNRERPVTVCDSCGGDIYAGETVYRLPGRRLCPGCGRDAQMREGEREWPEPCSPI